MFILWKAALIFYCSEEQPKFLESIGKTSDEPEGGDAGTGAEQQENEMRGQLKWEKIKCCFSPHLF